MIRRVRSVSPPALVIVAAAALSALVATAGAQLGSARPPPSSPLDVGRAPAGLRSVGAAECGECHADHYREWQSSAHGTSFTNPVFVAEFRHRHLPSCVHCHAPRGEREGGVDCATCHVRDGAVLNPTVSGRAPHASRAAPELATESACASCHEFDFDDQPGDRLQRTVSEWAGSRHAETSCQGCHLPPRGGRHAHHFPGGLDAELLRDAITVRSASARVDEGLTRVRLELAADRAGHAVPTGDLFRRVEVRVWPEGRPELAQSVLLARRFQVTRGRWREVGDRRVPPSGSRGVTLELEGPIDRVAYAIDLWRAPPVRVEDEGWADHDVRRRLAEGVVTVDRSP